MNNKLLQGLSIEEKRAVVELLKKKERVQQENKLDSFVPNPGAQEKFLKSLARIRAMFAGNGTGKTTAMVIEMLWHHLGIHPYRDVTNTHHTWLVIPSAAKAEDYWNEIKLWCPISLLPKTDKMGTSDIRRFRWKNGTLTTIYSHEQDTEKFEGSNISGVFYDEPPKRAQWVAIYRGLRSNPDYFICVAATPLSAAWMYETLYLPGMSGEDPDIEIFEGATYENKHISLEWIEAFRATLTEEEIQTRIYGKFGILLGRVYRTFNPELHVIPAQPWPSDWPVYVAVDPHSKKAHAALAVGITPDDNYVIIDEIEERYEIADLAEKLKVWQKKYRVQSLIIDNSGVALDWTRSSAVQILADNDIYVTPIRRSDKDVDGGINRIKQLLKGRKNKEGVWIPRLKALDCCRRVIKEFELYTWANPKNVEKTGDSEKVVKTHDEYLDCLRYIVNRTPQFQSDLEIHSYLSNKTPAGQ